MTRPLVYRRYGGSLQVSLPSFEVLVEAVGIPETQWLATACPLEGLHCDPRFLAFLDTDGNKRIRVAEVRAAVAHTARLLKSYQGVDASSEVLELDALSEAGAKLRDVAGVLLETLKAGDRTRISLEQVRASEKALHEAGQNGDGIIAPAFLPGHLRALAERLLACFPEVKNRSGQVGIDLPMLQRFREERAALLAHLAGRDAVLVWGGQSLEHARRILEVRPLLDAYFLQCRLVAAQPEAVASLKLEAGRVQGALGDPEALARAVSQLPIAPPEPGGMLRWSRLYRGPAFETLEGFRRDVAVPLTGDMATLADGAWRELTARAEGILAWQARIDASPVRGLVEALPGISDEELDALEAACRADLALKDKLDAVDELERLLLYQRWLLTFANNFISMPDLYQTKRRALVEKGTLILGGHGYGLSVLVTNRAAHSALTSQGTTCTLYVQVTAREGGPESYEVAVPVTGGRSGHLMVGKRGIFHDVTGKEFDAIVTQIIRQPVSLWEAMTMPFARMGRFITSKLEKLSAAGEKSLDEQLERGYARTTTALAGGAGVAPAEAQPAGVGGMLAAGGIALAAVGSSLAFIVSQVRALTLFDVMTALILIATVVMVPSGLLGWLKLRKRNLALLLEGSGWALNDRLMLTRDLARLITRRPRLPRNARVERTDVVRSIVAGMGQDDEEEGTSWGARFGIALVILFVVLWQFREPLVREACKRQWLAGSTCDALLSPGASPSVPPGQTVP
jgi:hypothetical protein